MKTHFFRRLTLSGSILFLLCFAPTISAVTMEEQSLVYSVAYGKKNAGDVEIVILKQDAGYIVKSTTKPSKLVGLFLKAHISETRFISINGELAIDSGSEISKGKDSYARTFQMNRDLKTVELTDNDPVNYEDGDKFESISFPIMLMNRSLENIAGTNVREVSTKRVRDYQYEEPFEESVKVKAGTFTTWKVIRNRIDRPEDNVVAWLNQTAPQIPVKIAVTSKGNTVTLSLKSN